MNFCKNAIIERDEELVIFVGIVTPTMSLKINFEINQVVIIDGQKKICELLICFHFLFAFALASDRYFWLFLLLGVFGFRSEKPQWKIRTERFLSYAIICNEQPE